MALLRAVLDGCSTTGRSLTPALGSFCGFGGRAALLSQERGFKKSLRKVDICLLKVRGKKLYSPHPTPSTHTPRKKVAVRPGARVRSRLPDPERAGANSPRGLDVMRFVYFSGEINRGTLSAVVVVDEVD